MVGAIVLDAANQGKPVRAAREQREMLRDLNAGNTGRNGGELDPNLARRFRFGIERINMARAPELK